MPSILPSIYIIYQTSHPSPALQIRIFHFSFSMKFNQSPSLAFSERCCEEQYNYFSVLCINTLESLLFGLKKDINSPEQQK